MFDRAGQDFGEERFGAALAAHAGRSLPDLHAALIAEVRRFGSQDDDRTLLLVRARA